MGRDFSCASRHCQPIVQKRTRLRLRNRSLSGDARMPIVNRIADLHPEITAWRRDIHQHPELLYEVHRTSAFVTDRLREFGCDEVVTGLGKTGVVGVIKGKKGPANGEIKVI